MFYNKVNLSSILIVMFIANLLLAQQPVYVKNFPKIPKGPVVSPSNEQLKIFKNFQEKYGQDWKVRWSDRTGTPVSLLGLPIQISGANAEEISRKFLKLNRRLFNMKENLSDLEIQKVEKHKRATHIVFQQKYRNLPIEGAVYAVHLTIEGKVYLANGEYYPNVSLDQIQPLISKHQAIDSAKSDLGSELILRNTPECQEIILPYGDQFKLAWKVTIPADKPFGEWVYYISAEDGTILSGYNAADFASAIGSVYDHHPEAGPVVNRTLTNLQGNGYYLNGTYVQSFNEDAAEAYEPDLTFVYSPTNTHFDEVMVYYHVNRFQDIFLDNLGYPYLNYPNSLVKVNATVHYGTNFNNAGASYPNILVFGDGDGVNYYDFAKEDVVIFHEYQHLVTEYITYDGLDGGYEEDAMDEAFSDYFGCSFAETPKQGEYVKVGSGSLRNLDNNYKKSDLDGQPYHIFSQVFSGALWDIRQHPNIGESIANILAFEGLDNLDQASPDYLDGRDAIIAADNALYGGAHAVDIQNIFAAREIGQPVFEVTISGPDFLMSGETGEFIANVTGGTAPFSYQWYKYRYCGGLDPYLPCGQWVPIGSNSQTIQTSDNVTFNLRVEVTDNNNNTVTDEHFVEVAGGGAKISLSDNFENLTINKVPKTYVLKQNHPNPFNPTTTIQFGLPEAQEVSIKIYWVTGQLVKILIDSYLSEGYHQVVWNGLNQSGNKVASGIYIYEMRTKDKRFLKKMLLAK